MGKQRATVMVCDNPDCERMTVTSPDEPSAGYYLGKGQWHSGAGGGPLPALYACSLECIEPAVRYAMQGD